MKTSIGDKVKLKETKKGFPDYWRKGVVIEISDDKPGRSRVKWEYACKTWVSNEKLILDV